jgi:hypothetical protein
MQPKAIATFVAVKIENSLITSSIKPQSGRLGARSIYRIYIYIYILNTAKAASCQPSKSEV